MTTLTWSAETFTVVDRKDHRTEYHGGLVASNKLFALAVRGDLIELTHVPSGRRIAQRRTLSGATSLAERLLRDLSEVNWASSNPELNEQQTAIYYAYIKGLG